MSSAFTAGWVEAQIQRSPARLQARIRELVLAEPEAGSVQETLALAADRVLAVVEEHPGDRSIALDLLAADALITMALLAQAEQEPVRLGEFAASLLTAERIG